MCGAGRRGGGTWGMVGHCEKVFRVSRRPGLCTSSSTFTTCADGCRHFKASAGRQFGRTGPLSLHRARIRNERTRFSRLGPCCNCRFSSAPAVHEL